MDDATRDEALELAAQAILALHERLRIVEREFNACVEIIDNYGKTLEALVALVDPVGWEAAKEREEALAVADDDA